jgi:phenylalanyl-tRNA synthetase beta chain
MVDVVVPKQPRAPPGARPSGSAIARFAACWARPKTAVGVEQDTTESVLQALGCELQKVAEGDYQVTLPSWRLDLEREIDLIEEIARVYGYNRFANTLPGFSGMVSELPTPARKRSFARRCSRWAGTRLSPAPSVLLPMRLPLPRNRGRRWPWAIR